MSQELEKRLIKRLRIVLQFNYLFWSFIIFSLLLILIKITFVSNKSNFLIEQKEFEGIIIDFSFKDDYLSVQIKVNDESLIGNYYFKEYELENLKNDIRYGRKIKIDGTLKEVENNTIPNNFNYKKYLERENIFYKIDISNIIILNEDENWFYKVKNMIYFRIQNIDKSGYMIAFILGNKDQMKDAEYQNYQAIGIAHLFALSGMHIGFIKMILSKLFRNKEKIINFIIINTILFFYGMLAGLGASIFRCLVFNILNSLNNLLDLKLPSLKVFLLTICIILLINSNLLFNQGFLFSITTVGGILLSEGFINKGSKLCRSFKLSLVAFLFSLPISLFSYYSVNILGILFNIFYIPFVSLIVYPLSVISFIIPFFYKIFELSIFILVWSSSLLVRFKFFIINLDFNIIECLLFYFFIILFFSWRKQGGIFLAIILLICDLLLPYFDSKMDIYYFDVGQGDSSLLLLPYRKSVILVDTGGVMGNSSYKVSNNIITFLKSKGIRKVDYLILSHGDYDHMGEAINLVENFKVENIVLNCGEFNDLEKELISVLDKMKIKYYSCIKELNIDKYKLQLLNTKEYDNENDNSNVIYFNYDGYKFLFMGDAGVEKEKDILDKYNLKDIDFLKVGHHGSNTSSSEFFIESINPKYSLISVGKNNRYGHPKDEVLETLSKSKIYRTDLYGSIEIKINKKGYKVRTCQP